MIDYISRKANLQLKMQQKQIDAIIITQNVDLYYFTGSMQTGNLVIPAKGEAIFFVRRSVVRAEQESAVAVEALNSLREFEAILQERFPVTFSEAKQAARKLTIATEFDVLPVQHFRRLESALPDVEWVDGSMLVREARMIKDAYEIGRIQEAARVIDIALEHAIAHVREGMTEVALMSLIETTLRQNGHLGLMRMRGYNQEIITGMVGSGAAAAEPTYFDGPAGGRGLSPASPQSSSNKRIELNEPILVDIGCCIDGYVIDQTRTIVIGGLDDQLTFAYRIAESILRSTETYLRPGTMCDELYTLALGQAAEAGLSEFFMGFGADQVKFLGHGIGLEIDELPILAKGFKLPLEAGMVIAIEPKFTFPGRGVVGLENSYLITEQGYTKLTCSREGIISIHP
ncbi:aminopeptidase P family protein [Paenibacillus psychroresistens]|uniref:Aminopeptidase P family protein n=1 Tax=Paenibacillus psychroresistens TaxID=1778678 RepID=A0A6B8RGE1_9BACL|nr:Xaa-Pro peptidase family protein [Paenibacillus psychroresistens]QGQ94488.1 aminopeptidase P family protein [Paenibacillus psychroresistens]